VEPFATTADVHGQRVLRSAETNRLVVPPVRLSTVGSQAFPVAIAQLWNSLPEHSAYSESVSWAELFRRGRRNIRPEPSRDTKPYYHLHGYNCVRATFECLLWYIGRRMLLATYREKIWQPCSGSQTMPLLIDTREGTMRHQLGLRLLPGKLGQPQPAPLLA